MIERLNNIDNSDGIGRAATEGGASIREYRNQHVLLHVKRARVEGELPRPAPGQPELGGGQHPRHKASDGQRRHLDGDNADDQRLRSVVVEGVEKRQKHA